MAALMGFLSDSAADDARLSGLYRSWLGGTRSPGTSREGMTR